jgi:hypothetical protein
MDMGDWDAPSSTPVRAKTTPAASRGPTTLYSSPDEFFPQDSFSQMGDRDVGRVEAPSRGRPQHQGRPQRSYDSEPMNNALQIYSGDTYTDFDLNREKEEENKTNMLDDIDGRLSELRAMGADCSRIPAVNEDSSVEMVKKVHLAVQRKYDRARCSTIGTDLIIAGAQFLGGVLDGTRSIGPLRPNFDGWHNTLRPKLRGLRFESGKVVSDVMETYNLGPGWRMFLEIAPSAILYSSMRAEQTTSTYSPNQMSEAMDDLRRFE